MFSLTFAVRGIAKKITAIGVFFGQYSGYGSKKKKKKPRIKRNFGFSLKTDATVEPIPGSFHPGNPAVKRLYILRHRARKFRPVRSADRLEYPAMDSRTTTCTHPLSKTIHLLVPGTGTRECWMW